MQRQGWAGVSGASAGRPSPTAPSTQALLRLQLLLTPKHAQREPHCCLKAHLPGAQLMMQASPTRRTSTLELSKEVIFKGGRWSWGDAAPSFLPSLLWRGGLFRVGLRLLLRSGEQPLGQQC